MHSPKNTYLRMHICFVSRSLKAKQKKRKWKLTTLVKVKIQFLQSEKLMFFFSLDAHLICSKERNISSTEGRLLFRRCLWSTTWKRMVKKRKTLCLGNSLPNPHLHLQPSGLLWVWIKFGCPCPLPNHSLTVSSGKHTDTHTETHRHLHAKFAYHLMAY